jgi:hypothetical protein
MERLVGARLQEALYAANRAANLLRLQLVFIVLLLVVFWLAAQGRYL